MERLVWLNGAFVPEAEAALPIRDLGLICGDAVFDTARTFDGRLFMGAEHIDRLRRSLAAVRLPEPMPKSELLALTEELISRNEPALRPGEDWWVTQRFTAGLRAGQRAGAAPGRSCRIWRACWPKARAATSLS